MAKSLRSKVKARYRRAKREYIDKHVEAKKVEDKYQRVLRTQLGIKVVEHRPKNAFLHNDDPEAKFPQVELHKPLDFRCENLPEAALAFSGNRRRYLQEEKHVLGINFSKPLRGSLKLMESGGIGDAPLEFDLAGTFSAMTGDARMPQGIAEELTAATRDMALEDCAPSEVAATPQMSETEKLLQSRARSEGTRNEISAPKLKNSLKRKVRKKSSKITPD